MLKVGDRVKHRSKGKGTVIAFSKKYGASLIEYDTWTNGHDGNGNADRPINPKRHNCYYGDSESSLTQIYDHNPIITELLKVVGK